MIRRQWDPTYKGSGGCPPEEGSNTVPDMNMSIRELMDKHARGMSLDPYKRQGAYYDTEIPQVNDLTDLKTNRQVLQEKARQVEEAFGNEIEAFQAKNKEKGPKPPDKTENPSKDTQEAVEAE